MFLGEFGFVWGCWSLDVIVQTDEDRRMRLTWWASWDLGIDGDGI